MGFLINLRFCKICGKQIPPGEDYCDKHKKENANADDNSEDKEGD